MRALIAFAICAWPASADTVVATRTLRAQTVLTASDVGVIATHVAGALTSPEAAIGMEARVMLYAGRPVRPGDIGPPALIDRNQIVTLVYLNGGLAIQTEGRALGRAAAGETLRVMNLASRKTVLGAVGPDGRIFVNP